MTAPTREELRWLDRSDPLRMVRGAFSLPPGDIYLDGNSLGALPKTTRERLARTISEEWGQGLIRSWNAADWIGAPARLGAKIAPLIGAKASEVIVADSTSVNLFKLLGAAMKAQAPRRVILTEAGNFPTDLYIARGVASMVPDCELRVVDRGDITAALDCDVAVLVLTHVHYQTGARFDMAAITAAAQRQGAMALWDLSHSAGAVEVDLNGAGADMAVGCGYKYLNGGPGAPAFLYAAETHHARFDNPLSGWMGHAAPFTFTDDYTAGGGMRRFLCGTPPILGLAALEEAIDLFLSVDAAAVFGKGRALCAAFIALVEEHCAGLGLELATPRAAEQRGSHVSWYHDHAYPIMQALIARGVIGDFRAPNTLRFGFTPLYVGFENVLDAVEILKDILVNRGWERDEFIMTKQVT